MKEIKKKNKREIKDGGHHKNECSYRKRKQNVIIEKIVYNPNEATKCHSKNY